MKIFIAVPFVTLLGFGTTKPVDVKIAKKQVGYGLYSPKPHGPPAYTPKPYGPSPAYGPSSSYGAGVTSTSTSVTVITTGVLSSSTEDSPIFPTGSNSTTIPGSTGYTPSFSSRPRTGTYTTSSTSTSLFTLTVTAPLSFSFSYNSTRPPYPTGNGLSSTPRSPITANSYVPSSGTQPPPGYGNSTISSYLMTRTPSTITVGTTSYITLVNTTTVSSRTKTKTWSLTVTGTGTASFPISPIIPTGTDTASTYWNTTTSRIPDTGTGYSSSTSSTIGSPVTNTRNSSTVVPTGSYSTARYPTAPVPYPTAPAPDGYPTPSLSTGVSLITGYSSSTSSSSTEGSPIFPNTTSSTRGTGYYPIPYGSSTRTWGTGTGVSSTLSSTLAFPIIPSGSSTATPSFSSRPRYPGIGSTTSTVTNLETFPTIVPISSPYSIVPTGTDTASSGSTTATTTTAPPAPPGYGSPIPYATSSYAGPGGYPYGYGNGGRGNGGWVERRSGKPERSRVVKVMRYE